MIKRILIYGFPFFLLLIESLLRKTFSLNPQAIMGPTLAATGAAMLLPLTTLRNRNNDYSDSVRSELKKKKAIVLSNTEKIYIDIVWLCTFLFIGTWAYSVYLASQQPAQIWFGLQGCLIIGFINYFGSIIFSEVKEVF